jgi:hypothetical protein
VPSTRRVFGIRRSNPTNRVIHNLAGATGGAEGPAGPAPAPGGPAPPPPSSHLFHNKSKISLTTYIFLDTLPPCFTKF